MARQFSSPCLCEMTNGLTVLLFCDVHIGIGVTLNLLQCLCVVDVGCDHVEPTMQRHHRYCWLIIIICKSNVIELLCTLKLNSQYDTGAASVTSIVSVKGKSFFFTSQIASLMLNF